MVERQAPRLTDAVTQTEATAQTEVTAHAEVTTHAEVTAHAEVTTQTEVTTHAEAPFAERVEPHGQDGPELAGTPGVTTLEWLVAETRQEETPVLAYPAGLHSAELLAHEKRRAHIRLSQEPGSRWVALPEYVEGALLEHAITTRQRVLVESDGRGHLCVVGMLQTRMPEVTKLTGAVVEITATESLTLRSGRAGLRFRSDGDVELVGSRISAASRGLLRLVGRALRLN